MSSSSFMKNNIILDLYKSDQTVFTVDEIALRYPDLPQKNLLRRMSYYVDQGKINRPRKGIYAKDDFNPLELANKIYTPSYISLETVLKQHGLIFQQSSLITAASYLTRNITCNEIEISYRKIKEEILVNKTGILFNDHYYTASKERAFLDAIYVYKDYHFDNMSTLNWKKIKEISKIYQSKSLEQRVKDYYQKYKDELSK